MSEGAGEHVVRAARRLGSDRDGIVADVLSAMAGSEHVADRGRAGRDELVACVRSSVDSFLEATALGLPHEDVPAPPGAVAYARTLARWGRSPQDLVRSSVVCGRVLLARFRDVYRSMPLPAPEVDAATTSTRIRLDGYFDRTCGTVLRIHACETGGGKHTPGGPPFSLVVEVLENSSVTGFDADRLLGVSLDRWHVGGVAWTESGAGPWALCGLDDALSRSLGGSVLGVRPDADTAWVWVSCDERPVLDPTAVEVGLGSAPEFRIALGEPGVGLHGFRVSHRQARAAQRVATADPASNPRVLAYRTVALPALVADRIDEVDEWVRPILGDLLRDDERTTRLRETARTFLDSGRDYHETAARAGVHRNTVRNRIAQVESILGRPLTEGGLGIEAALEFCDRFGLTGNGRTPTRDGPSRSGGE